MKGPDSNVMDDNKKPVIASQATNKTENESCERNFHFRLKLEDEAYSVYNTSFVFTQLQPRFSLRFFDVLPGSFE